jgi:hypothetical protein
VAGAYTESPYSTPGSLESFTLIDLNGDEILDVLIFVTLPGGAQGAYVLYGNPDGSLQSPVAVNGPLSPESAVSADFNGDGIPDLAVTSPGGLSIQLGGAGGVFEVYNSSATNVLPTGVLGQPYDAGIAAAGGTRPYIFQITGGAAPSGLSLVTNRLNSGADLFGTPTSGGQFSFTVTATDALGHTASSTFSIAISNSPISFGTQTLPGGVVGQTYGYTFVVSGGIGSLTFIYPNAITPPGLALNANGTITGIPQVAGQYSIPVTVTDSTNQSASQTVSLLITTTNPNLPGRNPGVFRGGQWWIDFNGDDVWTEGIDLLFTDGQPGDIPVLGDWTNTGVQRYGVFRQGQWWENTSGDRNWTAGLDTVFTYGQVGDVPIVGDWDNTGRQRIGVFRGGVWWLDINGDNQWTEGVDTVFTYGQPGDIPVIGDWTNTGVQRIGIFRNGQWWLDLNNDHQWTQGVDTVFTYGQAGDTPIVGDWTGTGVTRIGVFRGGQWWLDINGDDQWTQGIDTVFTYGQPGDIPVLKRPPF